jgi:hypothetical protein
MNETIRFKKEGSPSEELVERCSVMLMLGEIAVPVVTKRLYWLDKLPIGINDTLLPCCSRFPWWCSQWEPIKCVSFSSVWTWCTCSSYDLLFGLQRPYWRCRPSRATDWCQCWALRMDPIDPAWPLTKTITKISVRTVPWLPSRKNEMI